MLAYGSLLLLLLLLLTGPRLISLRRHQALENANITHVVTALRQPVDPQMFANYEHLVLELDDVDDEDIMQHFATSNAFIQKGIDGGGGVLVHCMMGISRSATLVVAYMLSRNSSLTPVTALDKLREVRSVVDPNSGFMRQLEAYHSMGCPTDIVSQPGYQRLTFERDVAMSVACGRAPDAIRFEDEANPAAATDKLSLQEHPAVDIRCRRCRRQLATDKYVVEHTPKPTSATQVAQTGPIDELPSGPAAPTACAHIFVDPLSWMRSELEQGQLEGKLNCPNERCGSLLGKYAWQGMRCSCGQWVTPAISLTRARVDEVRKGAAMGRSISEPPRRDGKI